MPALLVCRIIDKARVLAYTKRRSNIMQEYNYSYNVIIIGGGPAGISAALYAARGGMKVLVLHNGASALHRAERIQNYFGSGEIAGDALYNTGLSQAVSVGVEVVEAQVTFVRTNDGGGFTVDTPDHEYVCDKLVLATGVSPKRPNINGLAEYEGKGVGYCAVCDGFFYRKRIVAVIGAGEFAEHEYNALKSLAAKTYLLTDGKEPSFAADNVITHKIARIIGENGRVSGVEFSDGASIAVDGVFVAVGVAGSAAIARSVGIVTDKNGSIVTDERGMTNVPDLYAAGDCIAGIRQISKAVYDGMRVGMDIIKNRG